MLDEPYTHHNQASIVCIGTHLAKIEQYLSQLYYAQMN